MIVLIFYFVLKNGVGVGLVLVGKEKMIFLIQEGEYYFNYMFYYLVVVYFDVVDLVS